MQENFDRKLNDDADLLDLLEDVSDDVLEYSVEKDDLDLTDLLDSAYEKQLEPKASTLEFTSDFEDHSYQSIDLDIDIDPADESSLFVFDTDEDISSDDMELINSMRTELANNGYRHVELYDYDSLLKLRNLNAEFISPEIMELQRNSLIKSFKDIKNFIQSSKATLNRGKVGIKIEEAVMPESSILDKEFIILVWETVRKCVNENRDRADIHSVVTANTIVTRLLDNRLPEKYNYYMSNYDFFKFLEDAIPVAITAAQSNYQQLMETERQREKIASYLLKNEQDTITQLETSDCSFIKQLFYHNDNYVYYCADCQEEVILQEDIVSYILYAAEKDDYAKVTIPKLIKCPKCGKEHLLPLIWYLNIAEHLQKEYINGANEVFKFLSKVSTGTALTKINPSLELLMEGVDTVVTLEGDNEFNLDTEKSVVEAKPIIFSDAEYYAAIEAFSKKLLLFDDKDITSSNNQLSTTMDSIDDIEEFSFSSPEDTKNIDSLTFKELAICMASELSLDYKATKNKALYSLVMSLNEYDFAKEILDKSTVWDLQNRLIILSKLDKITGNDKELLAIYKGIYQDISRTSTDSNEEMIQLLRDYRDNLPTTIAKLEEDYSRFVEEIRRNIDLFAHTRILNINQISYKLLSLYVNDASLAELLDDITDRMIVNNYAEQFAHTLFRSSVLNNSSIRTTLLEIADGHMIATTVLNHLSRKYGYDLPGTVYDRLCYITASHLNPLKTAADAMKGCEYYNFVEALASIQECSTLISLTADEKLRKAVQLAKDELSSFKAKSYHEFYLKEFSPEEINDLDQSYRVRLMKFEFGRYVPKRLTGETLNAYIERYETLERDNHLSIVENYDYLQEFHKFEDYYMIIMNGHNVLDLARDNFALANFARCWLYLCANNFSRQESLFLLGYDENYFRRLKALCTYRFSAGYFKGMKNLYKVLTGSYAGPTGEFVQPYLTAYENRTLTERDDLNKFMYETVDSILSTIDAMDDSAIQKLEQAYNTIKKTNTNSSEILTDELDFTREDLVNDIEMYAGRIIL